MPEKIELNSAIDRREFHRQVSSLGAGFLLGRLAPQETEQKFPVSVVKTSERASGLRRSVELLGPLDLYGRHIFLKASFNSTDPFPATTHPEMLRQVVMLLREQKCGPISLVERSGMARTRDAWNRLDIVSLARQLELELIDLDELPREQWRSEKLEGWHWRRGVEVPKFLTSESCVVQICNLKTHRFGGYFSASLKNSIGLIAKYSGDSPPHNYMTELHNSPDQRALIAEVNQIYTPTLIVMDAIEVFIDGGPEKGDSALPGVVIAARDRVALDAVGVALLRLMGAGVPLSRDGVFDQDQLKRAVELKIGARSADDIQLLHADSDSERLSIQIRAILEKRQDPKKR